jgi:CubicO group peptidase (beta-lactamase class C family)
MRIACAAVALSLSLAGPAVHAQTPDSPAWNRLGALVEGAMKEGKLAGAVVLVGQGDRVLYRQAFGARAIEPAREPMTLDTIFDAASLTKVVATATSVMILVQEGRIRLNDRVATFVPGFERYGKHDITVRHLLTHTSGLRPDVDLTFDWLGYERAIELAVEEVPLAGPDERFVYSDINFFLLGHIVAKVSGLGLDAFARTRVFEPLGMRDSMFLPGEALKPRIAPTEKCTPYGYPCAGPEMAMLRGTVHDPTARRMGGVAGHAGLFTTADDLARFCRMILGTAPERGRILSPLTIARMVAPSTPAGERNLRGLGWDIDSSYSANRGELLPVGSFGHTGFTGTSIWIDPVTSAYVVFLSSRLHPDGKGDVTPLRALVASVSAAALSEVPPLAALANRTGRQPPLPGARTPAPAAAPGTDRPPVATGIDVLRAENFARLTGRNVGLVTNHTGRASDGTPTIDLLHQAKTLKLVALFSPEHGIRGVLDEKVASSRDPRRACPFTRSTARRAGRPTPCWRASTRSSWTSRTSGCASTPTSARSATSWRKRRGGRSRSWCSTGPTRSTAGASRVRSSTRNASASPASCACPSGTP